MQLCSKLLLKGEFTVFLLLPHTSRQLSEKVEQLLFLVFAFHVSEYNIMFIVAE